MTSAAAVLVLASMALAGIQVAADDNDEYEAGTAGGGGFFYFHGMKDSFGFYLDGENPDYSSLVLQARNIGAKVKAYQFDSISFDHSVHEDYWTAHAYGKAWGVGWDWNFHLMVTDMGKGMDDLFMLEVSLVDTPSFILTWEADGLGGGNIWICGE